MDGQAIRDRFCESAKQWICESYSIGIYYVARREGETATIVDAAIHLYPLAADKLDNFCVQAGKLIAGQEFLRSLSFEELVRHLELATQGEILVHGRVIRVAKDGALQYYSELPNRDTWFSELNLQISGQRLLQHSSAEMAEIDTALRNATPPFDGISDLTSWLGLIDRGNAGRESAISIRIGPPIDMLTDSGTLNDNKFNLAFSAHPNFDTSKIGLALREFPGQGLKSRRRVEDRIIWSRVKDGRRRGLLKLKLAKADSVLTMLTLGNQTIRRQWFNDPDKALNTRYVATQFFDKELKQLRQALLDSTDSVKFEQAVASLLYLIGFSSAIQVETQAPDILVSSPMGKLAIVECTTKISDFQNKVGKLVDRRNSLLALLNTKGNAHRVDAFLVCGLPKTQIATEEKLLAQHKVTMLCREDLADFLYQLRVPRSPDEILDQAATLLEQARHSIG